MQITKISLIAVCVQFDSRNLLAASFVININTDVREKYCRGTFSPLQGVSKSFTDDEESSSLSSDKMRTEMIGIEIDGDGDMDGDLPRLYQEYDDDSNATVAISYPIGSKKDYRVIQQNTFPKDGFKLRELQQMDAESLQSLLDRNPMTDTNVTLPVALMLLDPEQYPTLSRARKAIRKGSILIQKAEDGGSQNSFEFDSNKTIRGKVHHRIGPLDIVAKQVLMPDALYHGMVYDKPPFDLPVVYEDDHCAVVNKPAGVPIFASLDVGHRRRTIKCALPFALKPPKAGTEGKLLYPHPCHRLDMPTSGLLLIAKTRPALVALSRQFEERIVRKTYTAVVNGVPKEDEERRISAAQAHQMGVDIDMTESSSQVWNLIDEELDEKSAITIWRAINSTKSLKSRENYLTTVELKLKTGRYHQLRRHMASIAGCPIVGDTKYEVEENRLKGNGLFLCSNKVRFLHPYYNTKEGKKQWQDVSRSQDELVDYLQIRNDGDKEEVYVNISVDVPDKFGAFLGREESRFIKFK